MAMIPLAISWWAWGIWVVIGLVGGLFAGTLMPGRRIPEVDVTLAIGGALIGGWLTVRFSDGMSPQIFAISAIASLFVSGLLLWIAGKIYVKRG